MTDTRTNPAATCPFAEDVLRSMNDVVSESESERIALHLNECALCRATAGFEDSDDSLTQRVKQVALRRHLLETDIVPSIDRLNALLTDYEIIDEIGRGGMGIVYRARQIELKRLVALKVLPNLLGAVHPDAMSAFRREAEIAAQLKHSSIIATFDFGQIEGTLYYAMELVEGRTMAEILRSIRNEHLGRRAAKRKSRRKIDADTLTNGASIETHDDLVDDDAAVTNTVRRSYYRQVAEWMAEAADALAYAHEQGVVHGDVKPSNLLVDADGRVLIGDFGLARRRDTLSDESFTDDSPMMGTRSYMSPELVDRSHGPVDHRSDIYALGATMYEFLTFRPMRSEGEGLTAMVDVRQYKPELPRSVVSNVPIELQTICLKATDNRVDNRYSSAQEFADDLRRWLLDLPIQARRPSIFSRAKSFVKRHKGAVAASVLIAGVVTGSGVFVFDANQAAKNAERAVELERQYSRQGEILRAVCAAAYRRHAAAEQLISAAVAAYPNEPDALLGKAIVHASLNHHDVAKSALNQLAEFYPDVNELPYLRGISPAGDDVEQRAANIDDKEIDRDPMGASIKAMFIASADDRRAILDRIVDVHPDFPFARALRCINARRERRFSQMLEDANRIVEQRPRWSFGHGLSGGALIVLGRWQEAERALTRATELQPQDAQWWVDKAECRVHFYDWNNALEDVQHAISADKSYAVAYATRASIYDKIEKPELAAIDIEQAIKLAPN